MSRDKYTEEIVYQWQKTWSKNSLEKLIAACEGDQVGLPYFLKYLPKDGRVLECGCGLGQWVVYLGRLGYRMAGVEIVPECIDVCKQFYPDADITVGDVRRLPFADASFSGYISIGVVEHMIEGPETTLKEMSRILKPGGIAVLTVPSFNYFLRLWYPLRRSLVDRVRYNPRARRLMGKPPIERDAEGSRAQLEVLKSQVRKDFWPVISLDPAKGPLFVEYKCRKEDIARMLESAGFELLEVAPVFHPYIFGDVFGTLFFQGGAPSADPALNWAGKALNACFRAVSPHFFDYVGLFVARKK